MMFAIKVLLSKNVGLWECKIANSSTFNVNVRIFVGYGLFSIWSALTYTLLTHDYFLDGHDCQ